MVYFEALELAKSNYNYSTLSGSVKPKDLPPKVFVEKVINESCTPEDLERFERRKLPRKFSRFISSTVPETWMRISTSRLLHVLVLALVLVLSLWVANGFR